jgi:hypothetical protein
MAVDSTFLEKGMIWDLISNTAVSDAQEDVFPESFKKQNERQWLIGNTRWFINECSNDENVSARGNLVIVDFGRPNSASGVIENAPGCVVIDTSFSDYKVGTRFEEIEQLFEVEDRDTVKSFLGSYADLVPFLPKVHSALRKIFSNERLYLEVAEDPYDLEGTELLVLVGVFEGPRTALKRLEQFDNEWWVRNRQDSENRLTVDLRYE